jgi:hypothetical protein
MLRISEVLPPFQVIKCFDFSNYMLNKNSLTRKGQDILIFKKIQRVECKHDEITNSHLNSVATWDYMILSYTAVSFNLRR